MLKKLILVLLSITFILTSPVCAINENEARQIYDESISLYNQKKYNLSIEKLKYLIEVTDENPRLSNMYYNKAKKYISRNEIMKKRADKKIRRTQYREKKYDQRAKDKTDGLKSIDKTKMSDRYYKRKVCREAEPEWPSYVCKVGEDCNGLKKRWARELKSNLQIMGLSFSICKDQENKVLNIIADLRESAKYTRRSKCMAIIQSQAKYRNELGLRAIDERLERFNVDINNCPKVKRYRADTVAHIATKKDRADKRKRNDMKIAQEEREKRKAALSNKIERYYQSGIIKKLSSSEYKDEYNNRLKKFNKHTLNINLWDQENKKFMKNHQLKIRTIETWQRIYLVYMTSKYCDKNQGRYNLIQDMSELRDKMSVIALTMPIYLDPDVLWDSVLNSGVYGMIEKSDGLLNKKDFSRTMGGTCKNQQTALRLTYKEIVNAYTTKEHKQIKRRSIKRDF